MSENSGLALRDLLPDRIAMDHALKDELSKNSGVGGARLAWDLIGSQASGALKSVLGADVFDVVANAWCAVKQLHEYTDPTKHPSGERSVVYLGKHQFAQPFYPVLTVTIGSLKSVSLRFTLNVMANIQCAALAIIDGHITGIGAAEGNVAAALKYGDLTLQDLQSKKVPLPASVEFRAPGFAIL